MTEDQRRHIQQEMVFLKKDRHLESDAGKRARERLACVTFLRALGEPFANEEMIAVPDGPPEFIDVKFREARFQGVEIVDKDCRRQDHAKADLQRYERAIATDDFDAILPVERPRCCPILMSYDEVYAHLHGALAKKVSKYAPYGDHVCATLDALVCIHLRDRWLDLASPLADSTALRQQGWRSVSFIMSMRDSHVVYATEAAPTFLRKYVGQTRQLPIDAFVTAAAEAFKILDETDGSRGL